METCSGSISGWLGSRLFRQGRETGSPPRTLLRGSKNVFKDLQRSVSRKIKGSRNRAKAKQKLGRFYEKIKNVRQDFLHKATTAISKNHAVVVVEHLKV